MFNYNFLFCLNNKCLFTLFSHLPPSSTLILELKKCSLLPIQTLKKNCEYFHFAEKIVFEEKINN